MRIKGHVTLCVLALALASIPTARQNPHAAEDKPAEVSHDGLHLRTPSRAAIVYVKPDADFSVYNRFMILDCYVAFKKNWKRDYNRSQTSLGARVKDSDMERIKREMAELFKEVFIETLSEDDGYPLTDSPAEDVLLIRPAVIDLDATAPDIPKAGRSYTFVDSKGAATMFIELHDSVSGEILARAIDRRADRSQGIMTWSNRSTNRADARRILKTWAGWLRDGLDEVSGKAD